MKVIKIRNPLFAIILKFDLKKKKITISAGTKNSPNSCEKIAAKNEITAKTIKTFFNIGDNNIWRSLI